MSTAEIDVKIASSVKGAEGVERAIARLEALIPKQNIASRGPRNLPKPDERKRRRLEVRASRRANR